MRGERLIVPVAGSPELLELPPGLPNKRFIDHARHARLIADHCALLFRDSEELAAFHAAVWAHPMRDAWKAMENARVLVRGTPERRAINDVKKRSDLEPWAFFSGVAHVSPEIWSELAETDELLQASELAVPFGKRTIEAIKMGATSLEYSLRVRAAERLRKTDIPPGTARNRVASEYFTPMLRYAQQATIVDPFLGSELIKHRDIPVGALEWLLNVANRAAPKINVRGEPVGALIDVITTWEHEQHKDWIVTLVGDIVHQLFASPKSRYGVSRVRLFVHERKGKDDEGREFRLGTGRRFLEVTHGGQENRNYVIRGRLREVTTHLRLEKGLSPLGVGGWSESWEISYQPNNGGAQSAGCFSTVEAQYDLFRDEPYLEPVPSGEWSRPGVGTDEGSRVPRVAL